MKQSIENFTENEKKFLKLLLEKGNISDAEISKKTGMSKSTCSRIRKKMEKILISEYIPIIELDKVGIEVFLVLLFKWNAFDKEDAYCPLDRQIILFKLINKIFESQFAFETHDEARQYFLTLQNSIKNMNFLALNSSKYKKLFADVETMIAQKTL